MRLVNFPSFHVGVAAEAFAAGLFSRCGYDVSVQYGANQPEYDLIVAKGALMMKVSVKGSKEGDWGLTQSYLIDADYHAAAETWFARHAPRTVCALVLFHSDDPLTMPYVFLATPREIADRLKATAKGRGDTILHVRKVWAKHAHAAGTMDEIPANWAFSAARIEQLLEGTGT